MGRFIEGEKWSDERLELRAKMIEECYPINYDFFLTHSSELFYFLGYLAGDGGAWSDGRQVDISSCSDPYIIYKFRDLIAPKHVVGEVVGGYPHKDGTKSICYKLKINRPKLWSIINAFDVKSPSIFSRLPEAFACDFIRGFMDAEANINVKNRGYGLAVSFYQKSKVYLIALDAVLRAWSLDPAPIDMKKNGCHRLRLRLEDSLALLEKLYLNKGGLYLFRKYDVYQAVVNKRAGCSIFEIRSAVMRRNWKKKKVREVKYA